MGNWGLFRDWVLDEEYVVFRKGFDP